MNLNIDFGFDRGQNPFYMDKNEIILDPSMIFYLTTIEVEKNGFIFYVPDNLIRLIELAKKEKKYQDFLVSFLTYFRFGFSKRINKNGIKLLQKNIQKLNIKTISNYDIKTKNFDEIYQKYMTLFSEKKFYISMSPEINFLGDCIMKIMEFSKQKGLLILSKSRRLTNLFREKILSLEIPKNADIVIQNKIDNMNSLFEFNGGKAVKYFLGFAIAVGGVPNHIVGILGVAYTFFDP